MISLFAKGFVFSGALVLGWALAIIRRLIARLPEGTVRSRWYVMTALIVLFLIGYLGYIAAFWNNHSTVLDLLVPGVFFFGACFVWLSAALSLQTALDLVRIGLLEKEAITDPLTEVFNRRYLERRLSQEVATARRWSLPLSVFLLDIDHFKEVNDKHGHQAGDQVLAAMGKIIAAELRESDVVARYGGEEFLVIASHTPHAGAIELAERTRKRVESHDFGLPREPGEIRGRTVTVSIGVASLDATVDSTEKLVRAADGNLYRAKKEGRNRVVAASLRVESLTKP